MAGKPLLYLAVAAGGALGSVLRYLCSVGALALLGAGFPWGTLLVNLAGSLLIGFYARLTGPDGRLPAGPVAGQFVVAGFCGGFTTFSVFSLESILLLQAGAAGLAGAYVLGSAVLWLLAVTAGHLLAGWLNRRPRA